ncbi:MAG: polyhydroxyalkanoate synthesis regulator DNA-binding domain-containing protein [Myxococcota bacterium]
MIKRYANRKLYDTCDSRYVTLQQIAQLVRTGEEVRIIDNTSKEDLTNVTLAQIIYEEEKKGEEGRATSARNLRGLIQEGRDRLMESLRGGPMGMLLDPPADGEHLPHLKSPKEVLDELHRLADGQVKALLATAMGHVRELQEEVRRLQSRIEELEERLKTAGRRRRESERPPPGTE